MRRAGLFSDGAARLVERYGTTDWYARRRARFGPERETGVSPFLRALAPVPLATPGNFGMSYGHTGPGPYH